MYIISLIANNFLQFPSQKTTHHRKFSVVQLTMNLKNTWAYSPAQQLFVALLL